MPKHVKPARQQVINTPVAHEMSKKVTINGKTVTVTSNAAVGGKGNMRMKPKVQHKGAAVDAKKMEATMKTLKAQQVQAIDECEMIQKHEGNYTITNWKSPKISTIAEGGVFFVSGKNAVKNMTEEEFNKAAQEQIEEITKQFKAPEKTEEKVAEAQEEKKEETEVKKDEPKAEDKKVDVEKTD
ncbi:hypothetical protein EIN_399450 [Entamoeba invadens IP1]|uniref:NAC-A/B domain-containing protein n=1 Tax=Entamoeba invadens IP1 TaxID=370355 RepID=A0A0A1UAA6_ENTIV|nr:hypothetical protein EIN_399450 [Entamoeba invadens IP1]ELP91915.1 hypothetical protein EIN_399450 [Entamoeba invadens IP1]|eukprot:XP_004258686.1 hypothetical protein EIN_399450 [Entamoeba invadens IP1]